MIREGGKMTREYIAYVMLYNAIVYQHRGGIELIFNGTNLDVVQNPMLVINDPQYLNITNVSLSVMFCDIHT